jgi:hypothetical protein
MSGDPLPLGFLPAKHTVEAGRSQFFGDADADLPPGRSVLLGAHDRAPQFGFVGTRYGDRRVLLLGINPGNGPDNDEPTRGDVRMMPAIAAFAECPTTDNFDIASLAYKAECEKWPMWRRHCKEVLGPGKLTFEEIAYSNCLPWRTASQSAFSASVAQKAAELYVEPLLKELAPKIVIAMGKRAAQIVAMTSEIVPELIVWNRAQAATEAVKAERLAAAAQIFAALKG